MHKILCFTVSFISCLYMFPAHVLIIRRSKLHYTAFGIITPIGGSLEDETATYRCDQLHVLVFNSKQSCPPVRRIIYGVQIHHLAVKCSATIPREHRVLADILRSEDRCHIVYALRAAKCHYVTWISWLDVPFHGRSEWQLTTAQTRLSSEYLTPPCLAHKTTPFELSACNKAHLHRT